ncbi:DUF1553 domain-containing protein [bacterium]|nr:DUF1553 domain-containing protein [bacterium]
MLATSFRAALVSAVSVTLLAFALPARAADAPEDANAEVSFYKQIRPILQAHCQGCHQPAKADTAGEYVMTTFDLVMKAGESESAPVVPGKPDESYLVKLITPENGEAEMPKGKKPLHESEIELIRKWIAEGAKNDTPENAHVQFDVEHPPTYTLPPVVTSIDYSPEGKLLAVAGYHEVLIHNADGSGIIARLVGLSERIESVRFSPDGTRIAVAGGNPGRMGEIQVWNVAEKKLLLSHSVTYDTLYGASWSPDGTRIAFGCSDNTLRAINAETGEQVLFNGAHSDWPLDTVWNPAGDHVISVGRDMTAKLVEVATQRFIDNVTSITPGALKGGIAAVDTHPMRDEIIVGGADGVPKLFRIFRITKRVIGDNANLIRELEPLRGRVFGVDYSADGTRAVAGSSLDGKGDIIVYNTDIDTDAPADIKAILAKRVMQQSDAEKQKLAEYQKKPLPVVAKIAVEDSGIYAVRFSPDGKHVAAAGSNGKVRVYETETSKQVAEFLSVPIEAGSAQQIAKVDFVRDVAPVLSRLGCNQGTCHGARAGKAGFKLSLRGYDKLYDTRAFTDELKSRRANIANPDNSLMLLKATGAVPHVGGQLTQQGSDYYKLIRDWIAGGAKLDLTSPQVASIEVTPENPVVQKIGETQQMKVLATYSNGDVRDVTNEAFIESGNTDVAKTQIGGLVKTERRGEAPILARYEGRYDATTLTAMGDRSGFVWEAPESWNFIDGFVASKLERMKIRPSGLCSDAEFIRRIYLDLTGLPPMADDVKAFLADGRDTKTKRYELIDKLIGTDDFVDHWTNKWADLLQVNRKFLAPEGAKAFRDWIRNEVASNTPYDEFARKILTAEGSNRDNPAAAYFKILRTPQDTMENTTHLWLAVRFNCNKCHDHPFERWTQDQYYQTAAFFAQFGLKNDPASGDRKIGGTAVEGAKPLYEVVFDKKDGEVTHDRTGAVTAPEFPYDCDFQAPEHASRRQELAAWITSPDNQYFAKSYVNRIWGYLLGVGLIEPLDDIRAGNPPTNPELLDDLTQKFIASGFNVRELMRNICQSRTYQLSMATNEWNADDKTNYSHAVPKRLTAEALFDAIHRVTGSTPNIPGVAAGTRAQQIPDSGVKLPDGFLSNFGRPARESACECERSSGVALGPVMALVSGPTVGNAISDPKNAIAKLVTDESDNAKLINELFLRILNRPAEQEEVDAVLASMQTIGDDDKRLHEQLAAREDWWKTEKPKRELQREQEISVAKGDLEAYEKEISPKVAELNKQRDERIAKAEADLKTYEEQLPTHAANRLKQGGDTEWFPLEAEKLEAVNGITLERLDDRSIQASGKADKGAYTVTLKTTLKGITGFRIEALPYQKEKGVGPGIPENGNFVVTEFELHAGSSAKPNELKKVALQNAQADFLQEGFNAALTVDGNAGNQNAWALHPAGGVVHWLTFETKEPIGSDESTTLKLIIHQNHDAKEHLLGRFRISATTTKSPGLSLPESLSAIAAVEDAQRTDAQKATLLDWFRKSDTGLFNRNKSIAEAKQPVPEDPGVTKRKSTLQFVSRPVQDDPQLLQLRKDSEFSKQQASAVRLTAAQDLAWALINSPEFLFNH